MKMVHYRSRTSIASMIVLLIVIVIIQLFPVPVPAAKLNRSKTNTKKAFNGLLPITFRAPSQAEIQEKQKRQEQIISACRSSSTNLMNQDQLKALLKKSEYGALVNEVIAPSQTNNKSQIAGWAPLHFCASDGNEGVARLLFEHCADPSIKSRTAQQTTPLHLAAYRGQAGIVRMLLGGEVNVDTNAESNGNKPQLQALQSGSRLSKLSTRSSSQNMSAQQRSCPAVTAVDARALVKDVDTRKATALHYVAMANIIVKKNKQQLGINQEGNDSQETTQQPINYNQSQNYQDVAKLILNTDPSLIEARDINNQTPLLIAAAAGNVPVAKALVIGGNSNPYRNGVFAQPSGGSASSLLSATNSNSPNSKSWKADVNSKNQNDQKTPLFAAAREGHLEMVKFLLQQGADPLIRDIDGRTALHFAAYEGNDGIVNELVRAVTGSGPFSSYSSGNLSLSSSMAIVPIGGFASPSPQQSPSPLTRGSGSGSGRFGNAGSSASLTSSSVLVPQDYDFNSDTEISPSSGGRKKRSKKSKKNSQSGRESPLLSTQPPPNSPQTPSTPSTPGRFGSRKDRSQYQLYVNSVDKYQWTALHFAAVKGHLSTVQLLLKHGALARMKVPGKLQYKYVSTESGSNKKPTVSEQQTSRGSSTALVPHGQEEEEDVPSGRRSSRSKAKKNRRNKSQASKDPYTTKSKTKRQAVVVPMVVSSLTPDALAKLVYEYFNAMQLAKREGHDKVVEVLKKAIRTERGQHQQSQSAPSSPRSSASGLDSPASSGTVEPLLALQYSQQGSSGSMASASASPQAPSPSRSPRSSLSINTSPAMLSQHSQQLYGNSSSYGLASTPEEEATLDFPDLPESTESETLPPRHNSQSRENFEEFDKKWTRAARKERKREAKRKRKQEKRKMNRSASAPELRNGTGAASPQQGSDDGKSKGRFSLNPMRLGRLSLMKSRSRSLRNKKFLEDDSPGGGAGTVTNPSSALTLRDTYGNLDALPSPRRAGMRGSLSSSVGSAASLNSYASGDSFSSSSSRLPIDLSAVI